MHQHIGFLPLRFDEFIGLLEAVGYLLALAVIQGELDLVEFGWVLKAQVHCGADPKYLVVTQLGEVVSEVVATDPYRSHPVLGGQRLLAVVVPTFVQKHSKFIYNAWWVVYRVGPMEMFGRVLRGLPRSYTLNIQTSNAIAANEVSGGEAAQEL